MKEIKAENYVVDQEEKEEEAHSHRLSFGDLPMLESTLQTPTTPSARPDLLFEFSTAAAHSYFTDVIFCGKIIHDHDHDEEEEEGDQEELNEYQKRDYFATVKSHSLRKPSDHDSGNRRLSASTRHPTKCSDLDYHAQRVNITSLTSMSAKSRRRMFMFGPVKFKPEMELSAIKQRQVKAKLPAAPEKAAESGKGQQGVFKGKSHLTSVFARSLGCIPVAGGVEQRLGAAS